MSVDLTLSVPVEDAGTMNATYTDPDGNVWQLSDTSDDRGWFTTPDIAGWAATEFDIVTDVKPRGGETVRFVRNSPARITWPLYIWGDTHMEFVTRYRSLRRAFLLTAHRQQTGVLRVARPDGTAREIDVMYQDGFRGEAGQNWLYARPALTLFAPDGSWRDAVPTVVTRSFSTSANFFSPFPAVSSSLILGPTDITNGGDMPAWPTWTVTGPMTAFTAENTTTGQAFTLTSTLAAGETAVITTEPPTVRGPAGVNLSMFLNWPAAYLWGLQSGDNIVNVSVAGANSGTVVQLAYFQRYEGC